MIVLLTGLLELGHPQVLANQLTLSQPGRVDYAHHITNCGTQDFQMALVNRQCFEIHI